MASAQGKTVLVTGAAGGLGKAIAKAFLDAGANVVICDVNAQRVAAVDEEWTPAYGGRFAARQADVSDEAAVQELVGAAVARFGRLDVLVNNAGVMDDFSPVGACSREQWDRVLRINLTGPFVTTKAAIAQFEKQQQQKPAGGVIINIGSVASVRGFKAGCAYTVSKTALMGLTTNTAGFYGSKGIYCMALLPGAMETNISESFAKSLHMEMFQKIQASHPPVTPDRFVPVESVAKYCVFLSDKDIAPSANGSCIGFSKGWPES